MFLHITRHDCINKIFAARTFFIAAAFRSLLYDQLVVFVNVIPRIVIFINENLEKTGVRGQADTGESY